MKRFGLFTAIGFLALAGLLVIRVAAIAEDQPAADKPSVPPTADKPLDQAALEKRFEQTMTGATLVGSFTLGGQGNKKLHEEKYTIASVKKTAGDVWLFTARIEYGGKDATVPLPLAVKWAGDTPVITLTDLPVPGFGKFTARVLIYDNQYAGTWSGGDHGGHLFGRIVKAGESTEEKPAAESPYDK